MVTIQLWAFNFSDVVSKKQQLSNLFNPGKDIKSFLSSWHGCFSHSIYWCQPVSYWCWPQSWNLNIKAPFLRTGFGTWYKGPGLFAVEISDLYSFMWALSIWHVHLKAGIRQEHTAQRLFLKVPIWALAGSLQDHGDSERKIIAYT